MNMTIQTLNIVSDEREVVASCRLLGIRVIQPVLNRSQLPTIALFLPALSYRLFYRRS